MITDAEIAEMRKRCGFDTASMPIDGVLVHAEYLADYLEQALDELERTREELREVTNKFERAVLGETP